MIYIIPKILISKILIVSKKVKKILAAVIEVLNKKTAIKEWSLHSVFLTIFKIVGDA